MVLPVGTLVNAGAVVAGAGLGLLAGRVIDEKLRSAIFQALGLCTILIGLKMALVADNLMPVILSCVLGGLSGQALRLETRLAQAGDAVKIMLRSGNDRFTAGLVTASLLICVGAMGLVGALEEGLGGSPAILFSKSILDFFACLMLASVYGSGVAASAVPLLVYQGGLTLLAGFLAPALTEGIKDTLISTGGLLILGLGFNLSGFKPVSIENLLPALVFAVIFGAALGG